MSFFNTLFNYFKNKYNVLRNDILTKRYYLNDSYVSKSLLIIKIDAIGDYILFRDFLNEIRKSNRYKEYKITLCGNQLWKEIAIHYDSKSVDDFIWIKPNELYNESYKRSVEKTIFERKFEEVIYPSYSRTSHGDDLALRSGARKKITFKGDERNIDGNLKLTNDKRYDLLIDIKNNLSFEFFRYHEFFSSVLSQEIYVNKPILLEKKQAVNKIVICPGASADWRMWDIKKFHELSLYILNNYNNDFKFYICGTANDKLLAAKICSLSPKIEYIDLTGKHSLTDLVVFLSDAFLVLTNDSGPLHIAAACDVKVLAISNGNNYARFVPYPVSLNHHVRVVMPLALSEIENNIEEIQNLQNNDSPYPIKDVKLEQVINELKLLLV